MATVNYSVPDEVKEQFNLTFAGHNKSAIVAGLMAHAVEERKRHEQGSRAVDRLLALRADTPPVTREQIQAARDELRR